MWNVNKDLPKSVFKAIYKYLNNLFLFNANHGNYLFTFHSPRSSYEL